MAYIIIHVNDLYDLERLYIILVHINEPLLGFDSLIILMYCIAQNIITLHGYFKHTMENKIGFKKGTHPFCVKHLYIRSRNGLEPS
jgi:hypothetical protein